ncbi:peroxisomal membrane protein pex14 [Scheffersomyces spartinae]|uniref:Peroxisomal membrane protein PEX14 n=1 Tax=Scheffersomyces spartinae TaxID=45513 RepID=A0A9P7VBC9_9ASCO|nr:peroxisomal membrane protein pex14 [Scheffersomyces spartinae]KAG7194752.1 peroxisomal membrane protein pex14 [Scheffersomyces spartinae]
MNEELINSAVSFLKDGSVAGSPLNKKVEFLESKGLNQQEIEEALKRANDGYSSVGSSSSSSSSSSTTSSAPMASGPPLDYYSAVAPAVPERLWKDYFIMATATAGVTYGLYQVVTRYLIPSIIPPSQATIDEDRERIDEEFVKIDKVLEQMSKEQEEIKSSNDDKLKEIDIVINNVNDFLTKYNKDKLKFDDDLRLMKLEVDNLLNSVEKNMSAIKDNVKDELLVIIEELQSLKLLIAARSSSKSTTESSGMRIAPVSSIPSASEILNRAKAKAAKENNTPAAPDAASPTSTPASVSAAATPSPVNSYNTGTGSINNTDSISSTTTSPSVPEVAEKRTQPTTVSGVTAGGIPEWQMKHKQSEEEVPTQLSLWQSPEDPKVSQEKVDDAVKKIGVPAWQLSAS